MFHKNTIAPKAPKYSYRLNFAVSNDNVAIVKISEAQNIIRSRINLTVYDTENLSQQ
jgi:hypothetical protein